MHEPLHDCSRNGRGRRRRLARDARGVVTRYPRAGRPVGAGLGYPRWPGGGGAGLADDLVAIGVGSQAQGAAAVPVDVRRASVIYEGHGAAGAGLHVGVAIGAVDQSEPSAGLLVTAPAGVRVVGGRGRRSVAGHVR
jgi:hypothetical protein